MEATEEALRGLIERMTPEEREQFWREYGSVVARRGDSQRPVRQISQFRRGQGG